MWHTSRWKRLQVAAIAGIGAPLVGGLGRTLRWRVDGAEAYDQVLANGRRPIMAFWHGRILAATLFFRDRGIVVITSENFDGEWIARIIQRFGYGAARGSSSRGAVRALVQLKRLMADGTPTAFTVDGPRGPARVAQPGAIWLAKATGNPILPFHIEAARYWTVRSWDRAQVPRPFSGVAVAVGSPFYVARDTADDALELRRRALEEELGRLEQRALELIRGM